MQNTLYFVFLLLILLLFDLLLYRNTPQESNVRWSKKETNCLRGIAILLVIFQHLAGHFGTNLLTPCGGIGVAIFLVLSGYGLNESYKNKGLHKYWKNKFFRVFIPYFLFTTILYLLNGNICSWNYVLDVLFIKTYYWYMSMLVLCYIIFYITCKFFLKYKLIVLCLSSIAMFIFFNVEQFAEQWGSFFVGCFLSENKGKINTIQKGVILRLSIFFLLLGLFCLIIKQQPLIRNEYGGYIWNFVQSGIKLPIALFFIFAISNWRKIINSRILSFCGMISLELYLVHMQLIYIGNDALEEIIFVIVSIIVAYLFYRLNVSISALNR